MENHNSSAPEHDEKTGSFAPRTSGQSTPTDAKKIRLSKNALILVAGVAVIVAISVWQWWWIPRQEQLRAEQHPSRQFFELALSLNDEEELHGQGAAAEPPLEKRQSVENIFKQTLLKFNDIQAVMTNCSLTGHDLHLLDPSGRILTHYMSDEDLPEELAGAREFFAKLNAEIPQIVILRQSKFTSYNSNGDVLVH